MAIKKDRSELPTSKPKAGGGWQPDEETIFGPLLINAFKEMEGERPDKERHYVSPSNALSCARQLSYRAAGTPGKPMEPSGWWVTSLGKFVHRVLEDALLDEFGPEGCTPEAMIGTKVPLLDDEHAPQCEQCQRQMVADIAEWYCEFHPDESAPMKYRVEPEILTLTVMVDGKSAICPSRWLVIMPVMSCRHPESTSISTQAAAMAARRRAVVCKGPPRGVDGRRPLSRFARAGGRSRVGPVVLVHAPPTRVLEPRVWRIYVAVVSSS